MSAADARVGLAARPAARMALEMAPVRGVGAGFRGFFAAGACPNFAATDFRRLGFAATLFAGGLVAPPRTDFGVPGLRRLFFDMIVVY